MIHFVTGKPGGGKSMYAVRELIRELVHGKRDIVTNLPMRRDVLSEYLQREYPELDIPLVGPDNRLLLLDEGQEVRKLFTEYRDKWKKAKKRRAGPDVLEAIYQEMELRIRDLEVPVQTSHFWDFRNPRKLRFDDAVGTLFILDEVHLYFNARKWQETGEEGLKYLSQHRHFSDDVILVTQHADNVDGQFRRLVQDWSVIKNGYMQKLGWFRAMPRFTRQVYTTQPTGGLKQTPFENSTFTLDAKGIAATYNTASAAGHQANGADIGKKPEGLHPAWFVVFVACGAMLIGGTFFGLGKWAIMKVNKKTPPRKEAVSEADTKRADASGITQRKPADTTPSPAKESSQTYGYMADRPERPSVVGVVWRGSAMTVTLSDGTVFTEQDAREGDFVRRNKVRIGGEDYYYQRPKPREVQSVAGAAASVPVDLPGSSSPALPPPPKEPESAWETHSDGVQRLKRSESLADLFPKVSGR